MAYHARGLWVTAGRTGPTQSAILRRLISAVSRKCDAWHVKISLSTSGTTENSGFCGRVAASGVLALLFLTGVSLPTFLSFLFFFFNFSTLLPVIKGAGASCLMLFVFGPE